MAVQHAKVMAVFIYPRKWGDKEGKKNVVATL